VQRCNYWARYHVLVFGLLLQVLLHEPRSGAHRIARVQHYHQHVARVHDLKPSGRRAEEDGQVSGTRIDKRSESDEIDINRERPSTVPSRYASTVPCPVWDRASPLSTRNVRKVRVEVSCMSSSAGAGADAGKSSRLTSSWTRRFESFSGAYFACASSALCRRVSRSTPLSCGALSTREYKCKCKYEYKIQKATKKYIVGERERPWDACAFCWVRLCQRRVLPPECPAEALRSLSSGYRRSK
jgi:hypothetical protein